MTITGQVQAGVGDFNKRMTSNDDVFYRATNVKLVPGTINIKVDTEIPIKEDFRIFGKDIGEPEQDLLFEKCLANGIDAFRIRPCNLHTGKGGHGDNVIEVFSQHLIPNVQVGAIVKITFFRDDIVSGIAR